MGGIMGKRVKSAFIISALLAFFLIALAPPLEAKLFEGEKIVEVAGYPTMIKFIKGKADMPLVVFVPGASATARCTYGVHEGARKEDFLAYWLLQKGYNFLGVTYPLQTGDPIFEKVYPDFTVRAWGKQVATVAMNVIQENKLQNRAIVLAWSMGGKIPQSVNEAAQAVGLNLDFYVAMAATPPIVGITGMGEGYGMLPNGLADRKSSKKEDIKDELGNIVVPFDAYMKHYWGYMGVNQLGTGLVYRNGAFVRDYWAGMEDFKTYDYANFPLVTMLIPNSVKDPRHAVTDVAAWSLYIANKVYQDYIGKKVNLEKLPEEKWRALLTLVRNAPIQLSRTINGDHYFFWGESGARATADAIYALEQEVHGFKTTLGFLLGTSIK
jgi:hypothetical protein